MKFNVAWAEILTQNIVLRLTIVSLSLLLIGLMVVVTIVTTRDPIVIERGWNSQVIEAASSERTEAEITSFLNEALAGRFDSNRVPSEGLISPEELRFREQEQRGFKDKEITQRVLMNRIDKVSGPDILVDADRILSVGNVRSILPFPLQLLVTSTVRSRANPYGLRLVQVKLRSLEKPTEGDKSAK